MRKYRKETVAGIFVLIGLIFTLYMSLKIGNISIFTDKSYSVYAHFKSVSGLKAGNRVELHGIQIGSVSGYFIEQEKQLAVVELKINKGIKLYDDAVASIQTDGLLGDRYVRIKTEASGKLLKSDGIIETAESSFQELTEAFKDLPIKEISDTLLSVLKGIDKLVNSPVLEESVNNFNETFKGFKRVIQHVDSSLERFMAGFEDTEENFQAVLMNINEEIEPVAADVKAVAKAARRALLQAEETLSLRKGKAAELASSIKEAADSIKTAAKTADLAFLQAEKALGNIESLTADDSEEVYQIRNMLKELSAAARSIKNFTEYLERHPEALIHGKR